MYDGYLSFGGIEILGTTRAVGYTQSGDCPVHWLEDEPCATLAEALGDIEYNRSEISYAPWFDPDDFELGSRFLGASTVSISGLDDSTIEASSVDLPGSGSYITGRRDGAREVRVRTMLTADGTDGLEYGLTWLNSALRAKHCALHASNCGRASLEFLAACPPERGALDNYGDWVTDRTNEAIHPQVNGEPDWGGVVVGIGSPDPVVEYSEVPGPAGSVAARSTWSTPTNAVSADAPGAYTVLAAVEPGSTVTISADIAASLGTAMRVHLQAFSDLYIPGAVLEQQDVTFSTDPTNPTRVIFEAVEVDGETSYVAIFVGFIDPTVMPAGAWITRGRLMLGEGDYFDGDSIPEEDDTLVRTVWAGVENESESYYQTRRPIGDPYTDEEYEDLQVGPLRRYLHNVALVSGPLVERRMASTDGRHVGMIVEYTLLAETPHVYSRPSTVELGVTPYFLIQDVPFNIATHPSAEISTAQVEIGRNYIPNPSLESNTTGWTVDNDILPDVAVTTGRSTDIAAVGAYSMRARVLAGGPPYFSQKTMRVWINSPRVLLSSLPPRARPSATIWGSGLIYDGESPNTRVTYLSARVEWDGTTGSGSAIYATTELDMVGGFDGAVFSKKSLEPPVVPGWTPVGLRISLEARLWVSGTASVKSDVRIYADAAAITVP